MHKCYVVIYYIMHVLYCKPIYTYMCTYDEIAYISEYNNSNKNKNCDFKIGRIQQGIFIHHKKHKIP